MNPCLNSVRWPFTSYVFKFCQYEMHLVTAMGHVWTAPWQELSDVSAALVGCGHVSGLLKRRGWPLALMLCADRVPNKTAHFRSRALTQAGSPDPRNDRICITSSCPRQLVLPLPVCR